MKYKVWIEIEELDDNGEPTNNDVGVLPDSLGTYDELDKAVWRQYQIVTANGSQRTWETSDATKQFRH